MEFLSGFLHVKFKHLNLETTQHVGLHILITNEHKDAVLSVAFSPDGQLLASGSLDGTVKIWKQKTDL